MSAPAVLPAFPGVAPSMGFPRTFLVRTDGQPLDPAAVASGMPMKLPCPECGMPVGEPCQDADGARLELSVADGIKSVYFGQEVMCHARRRRHVLLGTGKLVGRWVLRADDPDTGLPARTVVFAVSSLEDTAMMHLLWREADAKPMFGMVKREKLSFLEFVPSTPQIYLNMGGRIDGPNDVQVVTAMDGEFSTVPADVWSTP